MTIANGALLKLAEVLVAEHIDKPVRVNEVCFYKNMPWCTHTTDYVDLVFTRHYTPLLSLVQLVICSAVTPWDTPTLPPAPDMTFSIPTVDNIEVGKALLGVIIHPNAKGGTMNVVPDSLKKLAENGTL